MTKQFHTSGNGSSEYSDVYLHEREGKWYAYPYRHVCQPWDILEEVEVNIENLLSTHQWGVTHCNDDGMKLFQHSDSCLYI
jgi:hypothetical protein